MKSAKRQPFAMQAALTLALGVSASFMHVAASPVPTSAVVESRKDLEAKDLEPLQKAKLRASIKKAMAGLKKLNEFLAGCGNVIVSGEDIPMHAIVGEPFTQIAENFREVESAMKDKWTAFADMPIINDELMALRRSLATARSRASQNAVMVKQRINIPETVASDMDLDGLYELAELSTKRLHLLVS
jgi:hypothetical protein